MILLLLLLVLIISNILLSISQYTECSYGTTASCCNDAQYISILPSSPGLTYIGSKGIPTDAFKGCTNLKGVIIPSNVINIGPNAFRGCSSLVNVTIPSSVIDIGESAFQGCTSLVSIVIPSSVTGIGWSAFNSCSKLGSIVVPSKVTTINSFTFQDCSSLVNVTLPNGIVEISTMAFQNTKVRSLTIPSTVTVIGGNAFDGCSNLVSITLPTSVWSIGGYSFRSTALVSISLPASLRIIGDYAFASCVNLATIVIPTGVTELGASAFMSCSRLTSVSLPTTLMEIKISTFQKCNSLTTINVPPSINKLGISTFEGCFNLQSLTIPTGVTRIPANFCKGCTKLASLTIPSTVTFIDVDAFTGIEALKFENIQIGPVSAYGDKSFDSNIVNTLDMNSERVRICDAVDLHTKASQGIFTCCGNRNYVILYYASGYDWIVSDHYSINGRGIFEGCSNLETIEVPASQYNFALGDNAFKGCSSLTRVTFLNHVPRSKISTNAFIGCPSSMVLINPPLVNEHPTMEPTNEPDLIGGGDGLPSYENGYFLCYSVNSGTSNCCHQKVKVLLPTRSPSKVDEVLKGCTIVNEIVISEGFDETADGAFTGDQCNYYYHYHHYLSSLLGCTNLNKITFPSTMIKYGNNIFSGCSSLQDVTITIYGISTSNPSNLQGFTSLQRVTLIEATSGLPSDIGSYRFQGCSNLNAINIPNSIHVIGDNAFKGKIA